MNVGIALPAALATTGWLLWLGDSAPVAAEGATSAWLAPPYVIVLGLAPARLDVLLVLFVLGLALAGGFGLAFGGVHRCRILALVAVGFMVWPSRADATDAAVGRGSGGRPC